MPYYDEETNEIYDRVSEWLTAPQCQMTAWLLRNGDPKRAREANAVTLPGIFLHYRIAAYTSKEKGFPPPPAHRLNEGEQAIVDAWRELGTINEQLYLPVTKGFEHFMRFWDEYDIEPLAIECTMRIKFERNGKEQKLCGTVDMVARIDLFGSIDENGLFRKCIHVSPSPLCACEWHKVVTFIDWKYSSAPRNDHKLQLATYRWISDNIGLLDLWTDHGKHPLNAVNWSVLLKGKSGEPYQLKEYEQELEDFFDASQILDNPKPIPYNARTGNMGLSMRCSFCSERPSCPTVGRWCPKSAKDGPGAVILRGREDLF